MAIINEIKCARCDRKYSGVRSRCPYCGARRIGRGKYTEDSDNAKGKMLISILIMAVFTVAAGIMLFSTPAPDSGREVPDTPSLTIDPDDINNEPSLAVETPPPETPEPTPPPPVDVTYVEILYGDRRLRDDFSMKVGETLDFKPRIEPIGIDEKPEWIVGNEDLIELTNVVGGVRILGKEKGVTTITLRAGDMEHKVTARVN